MTRVLRVALLGLLGSGLALSSSTVAYGLWSATATGDLTVSVTSAGPGAVQLNCSAPLTSTSSHTVRWSSAGATSFRVYMSSGNSSSSMQPFQPANAADPAITATELSVLRTALPSNGQTRYVRVDAFNGSGGPVASNYVTLTATSNNTVSCAPVTP